MNNEAQTILIYLLIGIICGLLGQSIRIAVGIKKTNDEASAQATTVASIFSWSQFTVSLFLGAAAGGLAAIAYLVAGKNIDHTALVSLITAGYAGADFIEGLISNAASQAGGAGAATGLASIPGLPGVGR